MSLLFENSPRPRYLCMTLLAQLNKSPHIVLLQVEHPRYVVVQPPLYLFHLYFPLFLLFLFPHLFFHIYMPSMTPSQRRLMTFDWVSGSFLSALFSPLFSLHSFLNLSSWRGSKYRRYLFFLLFLFFTLFFFFVVL